MVGTGQGGSGAGAGGSQGGSGEGGRGGQGGSTGGTTILFTLPGASSAQGASATTKRELGKVRILSHKVRGHVATIVLQVPAAGRITLAGRGVRTVRSRAAKAERLTLRVSLSKAGVASLHRGRHRRARIKLKASFKPTSGSGSNATAVATFV